MYTNDYNAADRLAAIRASKTPQPKPLSYLEQLEVEATAKRLVDEAAKRNQQAVSNPAQPNYSSTSEAIDKLSTIRTQQPGDKWQQRQERWKKLNQHFDQ